MWRGWGSRYLGNVMREIREILKNRENQDYVGEKVEDPVNLGKPGNMAFLEVGGKGFGKSYKSGILYC